MEKWKEAKGYEGRYEVSTYGRVRSVDRTDCTGHFRPGKIMTPVAGSGGYLYVLLYIDGKRKLKVVHRLVAEAFITNPDNLPQVNHKDENKTNNGVNNLEWCDAKYNVNYGTAIARASAARKNDPHRSKPVKMFTLDGVLLKEFPSQREAARQTGVPQGSIGMACRGECKRGGAYIWKFANGEGK